MTYIRDFSRLLSTVVVGLTLQACGGGNSTAPPPTSLPVNVAVVGLWGTNGGLVLTDNSTDVLPVAANGVFQFQTQLQSGSKYAVAVQTQPASPAQSCTINGGSGTVTTDAVNVTIDCGHGQWAWMGGSTNYNQSGSYGVLNTPSGTNIPGARSEGVTWVDKQGTLWLFGGVGYDSGSNGLGQLNDLWSYSNGEWTWVGGSSTSDQAGLYGPKGQASAGGWPGARGDGVAWIGDDGSLWLFGGFGFDSSGTRGYLNDLWKYSGGQWTWVNGSDT